MIGSKRVKMIIVCLFTAVGLSACGGGGGDSDENSGSSDYKAEWTYMVYMGADNNLSNAGLMDLNEMETVGSDSNINIVLQAEFSMDYTNFSSNYNGETLRFLVQKNNDPDSVILGDGTDQGNLNMANPDTLTDFIQWARQNYPAKHYALVIWDHGAGWKKDGTGTFIKGAVQDTTSNGNGLMTLPKLAQAVEDAGVYFDVINFDACLMAMYEVALEFQGLADYMVFSEEVEPGNGDPYDTILSALQATPSMSGNQLATTIVEQYYSFYHTPASRNTKITKSAVDMSEINTLHSQVIALADAIVDEYDSVGAVVLAAQENSKNFEYPENHDLYDFAYYLDVHAPSGQVKTAAHSVWSAVSNAVIANRYGSSVENAYGLSIYTPTRNQLSVDNQLDVLNDYAQLACNSDRAASWLDAVNMMVGSNADEVLEAGGFQIYIEWNTDADVDLYVWEPCTPQNDTACSDTLYAPWMGQSTPNGYFSADSDETGYSEEYYIAKDYIQKGDYDFLINYYSDGATGTNADVTLWYIDPAQGVTTWTKFGGNFLDASNPYPDISVDLDLVDGYSDWWYPAYMQKALDQGNKVHIMSGERKITITIQRKKSQPVAGDEKR